MLSVGAGGGTLERPGVAGPVETGRAFLDVSWAPKELGPFIGASVSLREDDPDVAFVHVSYDLGYFFLIMGEVGGHPIPLWPVLRPKFGLRYDRTAERRTRAFAAAAAGVAWRFGRQGFMSVEYEHHSLYSDSEHSAVLLRWYIPLGASDFVDFQ
jgi:hypothetical protein